MTEIRKQIELAGITLCSALIEYIYEKIDREVMDLYREAYVEDIITIIDKA